MYVMDKKLMPQETLRKRLQDLYGNNYIVLLLRHTTTDYLSFA